MAGTVSHCLKTWPTAWSRSCKAASSAVTSASILLRPMKTPLLSASATSACLAHQTTNLERRCDQWWQTSSIQQSTRQVTLSPLIVVNWPLSVCVCPSRSLQGRRTAWPWPSWAATTSMWWPWMETPRTPPSQSSLRMNTRTATSSATFQSRTWWGRDFGSVKTVMKYVMTVINLD